MFELCQETSDAIKLVQTPPPSLTPTPIPMEEDDSVTTREKAVIPFVLSNSAGIDSKQWNDNTQGVKDILDAAFGSMVKGVLEDMNGDSGGEGEKKMRNLIVGDGDFSVVPDGDQYKERKDFCVFQQLSM